jgi:hypothetical protein
MRINLKLLLYIFSIAILQSDLIMAQFQTGTAPTGANVNTGGPARANPGNITNSDDSRAVVSSFLANSDALVASNFGFAIPGTATIDGITVVIERRRQGLAAGDNTIQLTKDGTAPVGVDRSVAGNWPTTEAPLSYGGVADLWGTAWTPTEINSSSFGVYIIAGLFLGSAEVDYVSIRVDYTVSTPVELISFDGKVVEEVIELKWQTSSEKNNDFYH